VVPKGGADGVVLAQGGEFGGFSVYLKDGKPRYCYNLFGLRYFYVDGSKAVPEGTHQVRMEFAYDGGGLGKGGDVTLYVDGKAAGKGRVEGTVPMLFSADETADVGIDYASPVAQDYPGDSRFTGEINWVQLDIASDDHDHLIGPGERMKVAMARQ
jgi:arylsulfatase